MSKRLPDVASRFAIETQQFLDIIGSTEALWLTAPPASDVRRRLKVKQLEALYEAIYLRIFASWEMVLEDVTVHFMAGYESAGYSPTYVGKRPPSTLTGARAMLYGGRDFLLWHNPQRVTNQVSGHLVACPVETVVVAASAELERFGRVRHGIAHSSADARAKFRAASRDLAGYEHTSVGRFLRSDDLADPLNPKKRVLVIRDRLVDLVSAMST